MSDLKERIDNLDTKISEDEKRKANLEGKKESLLEKLKTDFNISNEIEIDKILKSDNDELEKLKTEIENDLDELEKEYED